MSNIIIASSEHETLLLAESDFFCLKAKELCFVNEYNDEAKSVKLGYYVGADWIIEEQKALYVEPKLNNEERQTNYLLMLFSSLRHSDVTKHTGGLFAIKFDKQYIELDQKQDLLTPLLVVQYLQLLKLIVRKGLKKSYYTREENLHGRIKGKVLVSKSIRQNILKSKLLNVYCSYQEFGTNNVENKLLKKALLFTSRYLQLINVPGCHRYAAEVLNYVLPAFEPVGDEVNVDEIKYTKTNIFYKEYTEALQLAKLILKKYGYNITNISRQAKVKVPPFWIDMSKLFELYVLGLLKDRFGHAVEYHFYKAGNELDYLLNSSHLKMVIDAKYKTLYKDSYNIDDVRQVSGYARLYDVYVTLNKAQNELIDCLIIYPNQEGFVSMDQMPNMQKIQEFIGLYTYPVKLPLI